jgi:protein-S-isoprenylcysteine O-methyltransferase Ste14
MKRLAFAVPIALPRPAGLGLRLESRRPAVRHLDYGDVIAKMTIVTLFSALAVRLARDATATGHVTGILLLANEALVVVLTVFRRSAAIVDRSARAKFLTGLATFGPLVVRPSAFGIVPQTLTIIISGIGLTIVVLGKISLGRSFGLVPANRGIVSTGVYRFVRHPIYLGYLLSHVGFLAANTNPWNVVMLLSADTALLLRAICEEETLARDDAYRSYMTRVHWRVVPGVF